MAQKEKEIMKLSTLWTNLSSFCGQRVRLIVNKTLTEIL